MRRLLIVLGMSATLVLGGAGVASAIAWIGPYPTLATCEASELGFQAAGHVTGGCSYRDLLYDWQDGYYFPAWTVD